MTEYTHLFLEHAREKEFYRTLEQRQRQQAMSRPTWRASLARTLRSSADRLDGEHRAHARSYAPTR